MTYLFCWLMILFLLTGAGSAGAQARDSAPKKAAPAPVAPQEQTPPAPSQGPPDGNSRNIGVQDSSGRRPASGSSSDAAARSVYSDSWAVIVGINDYQHPRVPKLTY